MLTGAAARLKQFAFPIRAERPVACGAASMETQCLWRAEMVVFPGEAGMLRLLAPLIAAFALCAGVRADPSAEALLELTPRRPARIRSTVTKRSSNR